MTRKERNEHWSIGEWFDDERIEIKKRGKAQVLILLHLKSSTRIMVFEDMNVAFKSTARVNGKR